MSGYMFIRLPNKDIRVNLTLISSPPPPPFLESEGTNARSPSPKPPMGGGGGNTHISEIGNHLFLQKTQSFTIRYEHACCPYVLGLSVCVGGRGGGGLGSFNFFFSQRSIPDHSCDSQGQFMINPLSSPIVTLHHKTNKKSHGPVLCYG